MRLTTRTLVTALAMLAALGTASAATAPDALAAGTADLILTNGHVRTPGGWSEALAVRRGVIVAVGSSTAVLGRRGPNTQVVDLNGDTVLPGLHDVHVHPLFGGLMQLECRIEQGSTLKVTQENVRGCAAHAARGAWVTGGQWDAPALGGIPSRADLDAVAPDHPVYLEDTSGHSAWVNSRALKIAGIAKGTPDPAGGIIERDAAGEPTGILRESATTLVRSHVPPPSAAAVRKALKWSLDAMLAVGITSFTEASVGFSAGAGNELGAYAALADSGELKQRVRLCLNWSPTDPGTEAVIAARNLYVRPRVAPDCVKIFLDGVPTDSHTAAMLEPYVGTVAGRTDEASRMGMLLVKQDVLDAAVTRFDRMGLTVKFHAAGDAAVRAGLNAIEAARKTNGFSGRLHDVGHCTFVAREDMARGRAIGATFEVSPYLWAPSPINDSITAAIDADTIKRVWPVRELIESGSLVVPGSDWAVVPSVNPWPAIEALVTREAPGGSARSFGKGEAITLEQAIDLFTVNAARHVGHADTLGRIEPGMLADVIVLDRDPFRIPITAVHDTRVRMTFIGGEQVYPARRTK